MAVSAVPLASPDLEEANEWRTAQSQFDQAAEIIGLEPELRAVLREVQREFSCHFPIEMDDRRGEAFTVHRGQHNHHHGPAKGGSGCDHTVSRYEEKESSK